MKLFTLYQVVKEMIPGDMGAETAERADYEVLWVGDRNQWFSGNYWSIAYMALRIGKAPDQKFLVVFPDRFTYTGNLRVSIGTIMYEYSIAWSQSLFVIVEDFERILKGESPKYIPQKSWGD